MKKILVLLANGFEEVEALTPVDYLRRGGAEVILCSLSSSRAVEGSHKINVTAEISFESYLSTMDELPDAVFIPGGLKGSQNIADSKEALAFIEEMNKNGKVVSAICAAPALVLGKTSVLKDRRWTCYPDMEKDAPEYEKNHVGGAFVTDGNIVTGRAAGAAEEFAMELVRILLGEDVMLKVKSATVQR